MNGTTIGNYDCICVRCGCRYNSLYNHACYYVNSGINYTTSDVLSCSADMHYSTQQAYAIPSDYAPQPKPKMTKLNNMMKRLLDADTQNLVRSGFINGDLELTDVGKKALWSIMFSQHKAELVALAIEQIKEEEK